MPFTKTIFFVSCTNYATGVFAITFIRQYVNIFTLQYIFYLKIHSFNILHKSQHFINKKFAKEIYSQRDLKLKLKVK